MSDVVKLALIELAKVALQVIAPAITGLFAVYFSYRAAMHAKAGALDAKEGLSVAKDIKQQTNGLTDKLVEVTSIASEARGNLAGRAEQKMEDAKP